MPLRSEPISTAGGSTASLLERAGRLLSPREGHRTGPPAASREGLELGLQPSLIADLVCGDPVQDSVALDGNRLLGIRVDRMLPAFAKKDETAALEVADQIAATDGYVRPRRQPVLRVRRREGSPCSRYAAIISRSASLSSSRHVSIVSPSVTTSGPLDDLSHVPRGDLCVPRRVIAGHGFHTPGTCRERIIARARSFDDHPDNVDQPSVYLVHPRRRNRNDPVPRPGDGPEVRLNPREGPGRDRARNARCCSLRLLNSPSLHLRRLPEAGGRYRRRSNAKNTTAAAAMMNGRERSCAGGSYVPALSW